MIWSSQGRVRRPSHFRDPQLSVIPPADLQITLLDNDGEPPETIALRLAAPLGDRSASTTRPNDCLEQTAGNPDTSNTVKLDTRAAIASALSPYKVSDADVEATHQRVLYELATAE